MFQLFNDDWSIFGIELADLNDLQMVKLLAKLVHFPISKEAYFEPINIEL